MYIKFFIDSDGVQIFINITWNRFYLSVQLILNLEHILLIVFSDEIDSKTEMSKSTGSSDSMQIGFGISCKIEIDNDIYCLDIDTSRENVCTDKTSSFTIFEIVINSASVSLLHFGVNVEA